MLRISVETALCVEKQTDQFCERVDAYQECLQEIRDIASDDLINAVRPLFEAADETNLKDLLKQNYTFEGDLKKYHRLSIGEPKDFGEQLEIPNSQYIKSYTVHLQSVPEQAEKLADSIERLQSGFSKYQL
ncbi:hypothetical protein EL18_01531 [Nitratireductor basaltis]|uniref:Uncharacterized protein n=2 Tax=Nitratireductor basaltis TaxID=472175 RepID=A0A084UC10_9HYPH|nr:hypothetical protein EL18_01531 [Nitratireductor basaltis]